MTTITLAIEDDILDKFRLAAAKRNIAVDDLVREVLKRHAPQENNLAEARRLLLELMDNSRGQMASDYKFDREEIYDR